MTRRILTAFLSAGVVAICFAPARTEDSPMDVFKPLVGTWKTTSVSLPSQANSERSTGSGEITVKMVLGERFVRYEGFGASPRIGRQEYQVLMTYDERQKTYRRWVFRSDGVVAESKGVWNADKRSMTWTPVELPQNLTFAATTTITKDGFEETLRGERDDGTVTLDLTMTARKKE